jgi:hypothetical protein
LSSLKQHHHITPLPQKLWWLHCHLAKSGLL